MLTAAQILLASIITLACGLRLRAAERATLAEAKAMLDKAVAHYKSVGRKQALADFTAKKKPFVDRDLYVVCIGPNGIVTAHGLLASYVGGSADILRDAEGKPVGTTIWTTGSGKGSGTIQYPMINPVSKKVERKSAFFQNVGDDVSRSAPITPADG